MGDVSTLGIVAAFVVGAGLGAFFFVGLKMTIARLPTARRPVLLVLSSMIVRTVVTVAVFVWIGNGQWQRYVAAIVAFIAVKLILIWAVVARGATKDSG